MSVALLFPGQGAQYPGFLRALPQNPVVCSVFQEASEYLGKNVLALDTEEALMLTTATQISLLIAGVALTRYLVAGGVRPIAAAGMSVGIYAAAVASGIIDFHSALTLVKRRAELMSTEFPCGSHGMAVVDGLRTTAVKALLQESNAVIANYNSSLQHVISGERCELQKVLEGALKAGAHTAKLLQISVASHTPRLMQAAAQLQKLVLDIPVQAPRMNFYSNSSARRLVTIEAIREELAFNMARPVRWQDIIVALDEAGGEILIEAPPGRTLTHLSAPMLQDVQLLAADELRWDVLLRTALRVQG